MRAVILGLAVAIATASACRAQQCGDPPQVSDRSLKAELEAKVRMLTGRLGEAGLHGELNAARTDVLSKYPNADKVRSDAFILYMLCDAISKDPKLTAPEKVQLMLQVQQQLK